MTFEIIADRLHRDGGLILLRVQADVRSLNETA